MSAVLKPQSAPVPTVKLLINGKFVESQTKVWKDVVNPATQEVLARVPFATAEELEAAISGAAEAFKTWKHTPIGARSRVISTMPAAAQTNATACTHCSVSPRNSTPHSMPSAGIRNRFSSITAERADDAGTSRSACSIWPTSS